MDELFEALTLMQTHRVNQFPVILMDKDFWTPLIDWMGTSLVGRGLVTEADLELFIVTDGLYAPLLQQVELMHERGFVRTPALGALQWAGTVEEALDLVEAGLAKPVRLHPLAEEELEAEP